MFAVHSSLFTVHCSLLTVPCSLFTVVALQREHFMSKPTGLGVEKEVLRLVEALRSLDPQLFTHLGTPPACRRGFFFSFDDFQGESSAVELAHCPALRPPGYAARLP